MDNMFDNDQHDIPGRFGSIMKRIRKAIESLGLQEEVWIDEDRLGLSVIDYFEDIDRLKEFEGIERISVSKIYAYQTYWLVKRKPVCLKEGVASDERLSFINEIICASMLISLMYCEMNAKPPIDDERLGRFYDLLLYNLKYRDFTQKTMELMIEAFFLGYKSKG